VTTIVRESAPADHEAVVALSLRAWLPVFASVADVLGDELSTLLHGDDWRAHQAGAVLATLSAASNRVWVAEVDGALSGFVAAAVVDEQRLIGEIVMLAVDPAAQHQGVGTALTEHATSWLREQGMRVALIGTGGDPGHLPARRLYEKLDYRLMPSAQYFRAL